MSEGEFEKRIKHYANQWVPFLIPMKPPKESNLRVNQIMEDVNSILQDAKKDFLTPHEISNILAILMNFIPDSEHKDRIRKYLEKEYSAVWKWFGE